MIVSINPTPEQRQSSEIIAVIYYEVKYSLKIDLDLL